MIELKGISWNHSRGFDPMVATAEAYMQSHSDMRITWHKRSLKEFGDFPIEKLAETFDLLVIDHPFVGFGAVDGCIIPLDEHIEADYLDEQAANSVGKSHPSYQWDGHQWALAIDAAAQISAYRADLLDDDPPRTWDEALALARRLRAGGQARVAIPIVPIDSLMSLFSIATSLGEDPCATPEVYVGREIGRAALDILTELADICHPQSMNWNPIHAFDAMSGTNEVAYVPLLFGYSNYGRAGYAEHLVNFTNVPGIKGAILGGTGYAISSRCQHIEQAIDYGKFVASPEVQRGLYFDSGGQPGHRAAWLDDRVNAASNNFFRDTLETLDNSYLRPRYDGYMWFQETAWYAVHEYLKVRSNPDSLLDHIDDLYRQSQREDSAS